MFSFFSPLLILILSSYFPCSQYVKQSDIKCTDYDYIKKIFFCQEKIPIFWYYSLTNKGKIDFNLSSPKTSSKYISPSLYVAHTIL